MRFMNTCDIDSALSRYAGRGDNLESAARILAALRDDADSNSDGWAYWPKPCRAARQLIELVERGQPIHATELRKALAPIRAFYTRAHRDTDGRFPASNSQLEY